MSWLDKVRPASFRGVSFVVEDSGGSGGFDLSIKPRLQSKRYSVEQTSANEDRFTVQAHVIGDDYHDKREQFIDALRLGGRGVYVDEKRGELDVWVDDWSYSESSRRGRVCSFSITFVRDDLGVELSVASNTQGELQDAISSVQVQAESDFVEAYDTTGLDQARVDSLVETLSESFDELSEKVLAAGNVLGLVDVVLRGHIEQALPEELVRSFHRLSGSVSYASGFLDQGLGGDGSNDDDELAQYTYSRNATALILSEGVAKTDELNALREIANSELGAPGNLNSSGDIQEAQLRLSIEVLMQSARLISAIQLILDMRLAVLQEGQALRESALEYIDLASDFASDEAFPLFHGLRVAVHQYFQDALSRSAQLVEYKVDKPISAELLAHELYGDVSRSEEIVRLNDIFHSSFLPIGVIQVLDR